MKKYCIVLASGTGSKFGADVPKQFVKMEDSFSRVNSNVLASHGKA